jgi:hypothetical protein
LSKKRKTISTDEFSLIEARIIQSLSQGITVDQLLILFKKYSKEKVWVVLEHLQSEQIIQINEQGIIENLRK